MKGDIEAEQGTSSAFEKEKKEIDEEDEASDFEFEEVGRTFPSKKRAIENEDESSLNAGISGKAKKKMKRMKLDAEGLALGSMLIHSSKAKRDLIEYGYHRYTNNDTDLPQWFVEDERRHYFKPPPVSQDLVNQYKARMTDMNVKTIKKVTEAKARKKKRTIRKMEKARKKAQNVLDNAELTEKEKSSEMRRAVTTKEIDANA